jgi:hypothetical protein
MKSRYVNEFSLSLVSFILLGSLLGTPTKAYNDVDDDDIDDDDGLIKPPMCGSPFPSFSSLGLVSLSSVVVAAITLFVYNMGHEEYAHYLEFTFNICTCLITFLVLYGQSVGGRTGIGTNPLWDASGLQFVSSE